jgi:osmotically-inducible protein OsmY
MKNIIAITLALPLLLAIPAGMSACQTTRMVGERSDDSRIEAKVNRRLAKDPDIKGREIDADVIDRVATLRGKVDSQQTVNEAVRIAQRTKGVDRVVNQLEVVSGGEERRDGDMGLKNKIGRQFTADPNINRFDIDVDVIDGVVYLSGVVQDEEAKETAERIATNVDGVVRVQNELQISQHEDAQDQDKQPIEKTVPVEDQPPGGQAGDEPQGAQQGGQQQGGQQPEGPQP